MEAGHRPTKAKGFTKTTSQTNKRSEVQALTGKPPGVKVGRYLRMPSVADNRCHLLASANINMARVPH